MNKMFALSAVVALSVFASSLVESMPVDDEINDGFSQFALFENDDVEIADISNKLFAPYCKRTRDETKNLLRKKMSEESLRAFNILFKADFSQVREVDVDDIHEEDVKEVAETARLAIEAADKLKNEETTEEKIQAVEERFSLIAYLRSATVSLASKAIAFMSAEAARRLDNLKAQMTKEQIMDYVEETCDFVNEMKGTFQKSLNKYKEEIAKIPEEKRLSRQESRALANMRIDDLGCVTTNRLSTAAKLCLSLPVIRRIFGSGF